MRTTEIRRVLIWGLLGAVCYAIPSPNKDGWQAQAGGSLKVQVVWTIADVPAFGGPWVCIAWGGAEPPPPVVTCTMNEGSAPKVGEHRNLYALLWRPVAAGEGEGWETYEVCLVRPTGYQWMRGTKMTFWPADIASR